jgi:hypothetical protein
MHFEVNEKWRSKEAGEKYIEGEIVSFNLFSLLVVFEQAHRRRSLFEVEHFNFLTHYHC